MKHHSIKTLFALIAVLTLATNVYGQYYAYDFSATAPSGQTLYYKIYDSTQVSVVHPRTGTGDSNYVSGDLIIPETVSYCGITYTVTELKTHDYMMGAFFNCKSLTSVYVPNTVKYMGEYSFGYCSSLASVHLPDSITEIRRETFSKCYSLQSITLGREVNLIYYGAFLFCNALTEIHSLNNVAPTSFSGAFYDMADSVSVYIPCGSTASYVSEWGGSFSTFIEEPGYALEVAADNEEHGSVEVVSEPTCNNPQAELLATADEGYHFYGWSITPGYQNIVTDNPLTVTVTEDMSIIAHFAADSTEPTEYQSYFGQETTLWNAVGAFYDCPWENYLIRIAGDTVVDQRNYKKAEYSDVYWRGGYDENRVPEYDFLLREDRSTGRLWGRYTDEEEDFLIADMSLSIGDTFYMRETYSYSVITFIVQDTYTVDSRRTIVLNDNTYYGESLIFVEGIGCSDMGSLRTGFGLSGPLVCCHKDGELVYHHPVQGFPENDCIVRAVGIDDVEADNTKVYSHDGRIVVEGADGETVRIYDITGRAVHNETLLPTGVYIVKVGDRHARKVAVIR